MISILLEMAKFIKPKWKPKDSELMRTHIKATSKTKKERQRRFRKFGKMYLYGDKRPALKEKFLWDN